MSVNNKDKDVLINNFHINSPSGAVHSVLSDLARQVNQTQENSQGRYTAAQIQSKLQVVRDYITGNLVTTANINTDDAELNTKLTTLKNNTYTKSIIDSKIAEVASGITTSGSTVATILFETDSLLKDGSTTLVNGTPTLNFETLQNNTSFSDYDEIIFSWTPKLSDTLLLGQHATYTSRVLSFPGSLFVTDALFDIEITPNVDDWRRLRRIIKILSDTTFASISEQEVKIARTANGADFGTFKIIGKVF